MALRTKSISGGGIELSTSFHGMEKKDCHKLGTIYVTEDGQFECYPHNWPKGKDPIMVDDYDDAVSTCIKESRTSPR